MVALNRMELSSGRHYPSLAAAQWRFLLADNEPSARRLALRLPGNSRRLVAGIRDHDHNLGPGFAEGCDGFF